MAAAGAGLLSGGCGLGPRNGSVPPQAMGPSKDTLGAGSLRAHAAAKGLLTGFAVQPGLLRIDPIYAATVREQASLIVAENAMKWDAMRPSATTFNFDAADYLVGLAEQNRMKIRGHNLLWHRSIPRWVYGDGDQT